MLRVQYFPIIEQIHLRHTGEFFMHLREQVLSPLCPASVAMALKLVSDTLDKIDSIQGSEGAETVATALSVTANLLRVSEGQQDAQQSVK